MTASDGNQPSAVADKPDAAPGPVIRRARRISDPAPGSSQVPTFPPETPDPAVLSAASPVRARVVAGPRDVQADNIRHTAATLSAPPEDFETLRKKVFAAFTADRIQPVPVTGTYRLGIMLVSLFMMLLPVLYLMLIGLVGWGIWYHAINHSGMMASAAASASGRNSGRAAVFAFLVYVSPIMMGSVLIVFMLKPLFSRPASDSGRRTLRSSDEPLLFEFVERICRAVNSPRPTRIDIDCNINASAGFGRGLLSMVGNDLVLTIGMPLVAGLTMRQFAGVLAHEFGHFAQGAGMRLSYVIRTVSYWFTFAVYERDAWDERLAEWSRGLDIRIGWILYLTRFSIWLTRKILWVLMKAGHFIGGYLLRQMEFDADRHEARLAGSRIFATTARQLQVLGVAYGGAMNDLSGFYREGRLGDNLPKLILLNVDQLPEKVHTKIDEQILSSGTGWFDTHPCDRERLASAAKENTDGIFTLRLPAAHLFRRFDYLSRAVTWDFYKEIFGDELKKSDLHDVDKLMEIQKTQQASWKALRRFFQGTVAWYRPFRTPTEALTRPKEPPKTVAVLKSSREKMLREVASYAEAFRKYDECDTQLIEIGMAEVLLKANVRIRRNDFSVPLTSRKEIDSARESAEVLQGQMESRMLPFEEAAMDRLYAGLQLARVPKVEEAISRLGVPSGELDQLLTTFRQLNERMGQLLVIRDTQIALGKLLAILEHNSGNQKYFDEVKARMAEMNDHIRNLRDSFATTPYPFDHAKSDITIAEYLLKELPDAENPFSLYEAADSIGNALPPMHARIIGRLCEIAESVETSIGLPELPDPPEEETPDSDDEEGE